MAYSVDFATYSTIPTSATGSKQVPVAGKYFVYAMFTVRASQSGDKIGTIFKNGTGVNNIVAESVVSVSSAEVPYWGNISLQQIVECKAGDTLKWSVIANAFENNRSRNAFGFFRVG